MSQTWLKLPSPKKWSARGRRRFLDFARSVESGAQKDSAEYLAAKETALRMADPSLTAAVHVLNDLVSQGWSVRVDARGPVSVAPPLSDDDAIVEKARVQRQELLKRDEQLSSPSVKRFISEMEKPREFRGTFVSVFNLMRDGKNLAASLRSLAAHSGADPFLLKRVIDPYVQVVSGDERCPHTGLRLIDIWRYFRHTWTNQYTSTPGRTILFLVRDRAANFHPVIGIAALGSAIVQIRERDEWIGWDPKKFLASITAAPTLKMARWIVARLERSRDDLYLDDLLRDRLYWPSLWKSPTLEAIDRLVEEADLKRRHHHRFVRRSDFKWSVGAASWPVRAESDLFRSKRCRQLAELLRARLALAPFLYPKPTAKGLHSALMNSGARRAIVGVLRRAKADSVGTEIADLTVCGAIAPYNAILGGKLVSMLAVSPAAIKAYHARYRDYASEIASSMAGRSMRRRSHLVFVGTTSLYGSSSSQYNRLRIPSDVLSGESDIVFSLLGKSRSFGTSHLSAASVRALVQLAEQSRDGIRVNNIFGEGVNPKFRKVRSGLDLIGWPSDELLQHHRQRIVYGVSLVANLLPYLLGLDKKPRYVFDRMIDDDVDRIAHWWWKRWLRERVKSEEVLAKVGLHSLDRPVHHGARVAMPPLTECEELDVSWPLVQHEHLGSLGHSERGSVPIRVPAMSHVE